jgi:hypothetical protein
MTTATKTAGSPRSKTMTTELLCCCGKRLKVKCHVQDGVWRS